MASSAVKFLVFDIESVADGDLVSKIRYPGEGLAPEEAIARYRGELMEETGRDFIPYTFQIPVSVVVAKVGASYELIDLVALDEPEFRSHVITDHFWRGWEGYRRPTLVSFNGRTFDMPLMELAAFRYGLSVPGWFNIYDKSWEQYRSRYNTQSHLDLHDLLTNFGASRFNGGLNLAANVLGKPGKMEIQGHMVQDLFNEGKLAEINDYCRCDVLDTYFVFLRSSVLLGRISLDREREIVGETKQWITDRADQVPAYRSYLDNWGDWQNPRSETGPAASD
ncbi:MAG: 3'-5' exonuclease [Planctomycetes bacterium]|nr:3'-5' exonuclease [Planctomycetota bacterium]MBL7044403.1 3'-5' exonuclease [Pirellulaceae bacterium]